MLVRPPKIRMNEVGVVPWLDVSMLWQIGARIVASSWGSPLPQELVGKVL